MRGFRLAHHGRPVAVPQTVQRLLGFLALAGGPLQRLYVAGNLWMDSSEAQANASLRTALWRVGQTGVPLLDATSTHIGLREDVEVDARTVESAALGALNGEWAQVDFLHLASVGELLPDWYDDWVIVKRERLRQLQLHALERLCAQLAGQGRFAHAVAAGTAAVAGEPLRESAHRVLIEAFLLEGNACDALRQYRICRDLLRDQLGLEPSPALAELVAQLPGDAGVTVR